MAAGLSGKQFVIDYLNQLKLKPSKNFRQFWNDLEYQHGRRAIAPLKEAMSQRNPGATTNDIYVLKNQNLKLSLDFAKYSADLYRRFFDWLVARPHPQAGRLLDVGCDNGIVTCFIASLFPESEVVGVDIEPQAVACAEELANRLGLTNVRFFQSDVRQLDTLLDARSFDRILSVRSFHEMLGEVSEPPRHWSTQELLGRSVEAGHLHLLRMMRNLLRDEAAELITFERLPWLASAAMWADELKQAGLFVDWAQAEFIAFQEVGENQEMPVFVCRTTPSDSAILEGVYRLYGAGSAAALMAGAEYEDAEAEALFYRIESKQFLSGIQIDFPEDTQMRYELWQTESSPVLYQYTNVGNRKLNVLSVGDLETAMRDFEVTLPAHYQNQGFKVKTYHEQVQRGEK